MSIRAPVAVVWTTLLAPRTIPRILAVDQVLAPWRPSQPFAWIFEMNGHRATVEGRVHRMEAPRLLAYEYVDPHARDTLRVTNVHQVTIELAAEAEGTRVTVTEDAHLSAPAHAHAEGGWRLALANLRALIELEAAPTRQG